MFFSVLKTTLVINHPKCSPVSNNRLPSRPLSVAAILNGSGCVAVSLPPSLSHSLFGLLAHCRPLLAACCYSHRPPFTGISL
ncbi:hypothetical protein L1887_11061 [Cichorium endivia]|nr:hypothetical protein L1887_11061 [Cichorium endivia]